MGDNLYRPIASDTTNKLVYHSGNFSPSSKLDKSVWDAIFEVTTENNIPVLKVKRAILGIDGISAYATGPSSGGGGGGLDYDLLKQALTGAIIPDGYPFTISASFLQAIDKTYLTGKLANTYADKVHTHLYGPILPASPRHYLLTEAEMPTRWIICTPRLSRVPIKHRMSISNTVNGPRNNGMPGQTLPLLLKDTIQYNRRFCYFMARRPIAPPTKYTVLFNSDRWFVRGGGTSPTAKAGVG
ncbi:MAG: hypothetical protein ACLR8Y_15590 [Alistipes indistinctus]